MSHRIRQGNGSRQVPSFIPFSNRKEGVMFCQDISDVILLPLVARPKLFKRDHRKIFNLDINKIFYFFVIFLCPAAILEYEGKHLKRKREFEYVNITKKCKHKKF